MGSRRLPHPAALESPLPQVGRDKARAVLDCCRPTISGTLARGRGVAGALGADDAVDNGHAGHHDCSHHIAISTARWPITRLSDTAPDFVCPAAANGGAGRTWALKSPSAYWLAREVPRFDDRYVRELTIDHFLARGRKNRTLAVAGR